MDIRNSFDITLSETLIQRLQQTKAAAKQSLNHFTNKAQQVSGDWKQAATENTENAIDTFNNTIEQAKGSLEQNLPQVSVQTVINSSIADWFERHPAFLGIIKLLNWAANHPIFSLIILVFSLAILWNLVKLIGRLIEKASLSILQIPLKLLGSLIKYSWFYLGKLSNFTQDKFIHKKAISTHSKLQLHNNFYPITSYNKQQRLKDISKRLEEIQTEQQELLQEAADILDAEKINSLVN